MLSTDQTADAAGSFARVKHAQPRPVALAPNQPLGARGLELSSPSQEGAVGSHKDLGVEKAAAVSLRHAHHHDASRLSRGNLSRWKERDGSGSDMDGRHCETMRSCIMEISGPSSETAHSVSCW